MGSHQRYHHSRRRQGTERILEISEAVKKDNTGITVLKKDGRNATSPQQKAEMLNAQFSSVFTEEDTENLPQLNKQYPSLSTLSVSAIGVEKLLLNLNASKAAGPDKLSGKLLKATAHEIAPVLQVIFQRSIDEGTLPQAWKEATISPVYKKECRSNPANYRPVSLTCTVLELGGFVSQFATHFYRVANQFSKWFAVCESFYEGMDCIIIHLLLMPATRNKPVCNLYQLYVGFP